MGEQTTWGTLCTEFLFCNRSSGWWLRGKEDRTQHTHTKAFFNPCSREYHNETKGAQSTVHTMYVLEGITSGITRYVHHMQVRRAFSGDATGRPPYLCTLAAGELYIRRSFFRPRHDYY